RKMMPHPSWDENYASGQLPWDTGQPEPMLVEFVTARGSGCHARRLRLGRVLALMRFGWRNTGSTYLVSMFRRWRLKERVRRLGIANFAVALPRWIFSQRLHR